MHDSYMFNLDNFDVVVANNWPVVIMQITSSITSLLKPDMHMVLNRGASMGFVTQTRLEVSNMDTCPTVGLGNILKN